MSLFVGELDGRDPITLEMALTPGAESHAPDAFGLYVVGGSAAGAVFLLDRDHYTIGRSLDADLRFLDEDLSRLHARIDRRSGGVTVTDLGSRNGTHVNGQRIDDAHGLLDGDQITLGSLVLRFAVQSVSDIRVAQRVYESSVRDHLTGLFNRRHFEDLLRYMAKVADDESSLCLCMLDLDGLREINSSAGRTVCDDLLRSITSKLRSTLGPEEIIARWGGEEFVVLSRTNEPLATADRLRGIVASAQVRSPQGPLGVTASVGVVRLSEGAKPDALLRAVEHALNEAKGAGGNRSVLAFGAIAPTPSGGLRYSEPPVTTGSVRPPRRMGRATITTEEVRGQKRDPRREED